MITTVQCNIGCLWVDVGVQCDLGYPISTSTPLQQFFIERESEVSECVRVIKNSNKTLDRARDPPANGAWLNKLTE